MRAMMERASIEYLMAGFFMKLNMKAAAATMSMMTYCTMVTDSEPQNESAGTSVKVRLHWSIFTAYFWNGKIAE